MESFERKSEVRALYSEHLSDQFSPIVVSMIGNEKERDELSQNFVDEVEKNGINVAHSDRAAAFGHSKFTERVSNGEWYSIFSNIDAADKFSRNFNNCFGYIAVGANDTTEINESFMVHTDPKHFMKQKDGEFDEALAIRLEELMDRSSAGSVDILIFGSYTYAVDCCDADAYARWVTHLSNQTKKSAGFNPVIITPKFSDNYYTHAYFKNDERRLVIEQPIGNAYIDPQSAFDVGDIHGVQKEWQEEMLRRFFPNGVLEKFK